MRTGRFIAAVAFVIGVAACLVATPRVQAQTLDLPRARQGYYIGVGYRLTFNKVWMDNENYGVWGGSDLSLRFGQMVTRRFGMGLLIHSGGAKGDGQTAGTFGLELEGQWELVKNLALHGGVGVDTFQVTADDGKDKSLRGTAGSGYMLGAGYSWFFTHRLTGGWAATPRVEFRFVPGTTTQTFTTLVGVELCWWSGLPRNQLELPPSEAYKP